MNYKELLNKIVTEQDLRCSIKMLKMTLKFSSLPIVNNEI